MVSSYSFLKSSDHQCGNIIALTIQYHFSILKSPGSRYLIPVHMTQDHALVEI